MENLTVSKLKALAKQRKIRGYSVMSKSQLVEKLSGESLAQSDRQSAGSGACCGSPTCDCKMEGKGLGEKVKDALSRVRALKAKIAGSGTETKGLAQLEEEVEGGGDKIDWEDIKWGSFTAQFNQWNKQHPRDKKTSLDSFADMILKDPSKYSTKTVRRARFYKNVLHKK